MMNLAQRAAATQATWNKYRDRPFAWKGATCVHVLRFHLRAMGHRPPAMPAFQSPIGAKRALMKMGSADLTGLLRRLQLIEITPLEMIVGDVAILPGDDSFDALTICAGNKFMGFHAQAEGFVSMEVRRGAIKASFRV